MTKHEQLLSLLPAKFQDPVIVTLPTGLIMIYEAVSPINKEEIWLRISDGWYSLEEKDKNYDLMADAILNRLNKQQCNITN